MTAALLLSIFKAIPALEKIYLESIELYYKQQEAADQARYAKNKAAREAIIRAMERPGVSDDEFKELRISLYNLRRG